MTKELLHSEIQPSLGSAFISAGTAARIIGVQRPSITRYVQAGRLRPVTHVDHGAHRIPIFDRRDAERIRDQRNAVPAGDILDWLDRAAKATVGVAGESRQHWLNAIDTIVKRTGGTFHTGQIRARVPEWAHGPECGALITGLVRSGLIEWTGDFALSGDSKNRHALTPVKVYRVLGAVS